MCTLSTPWWLRKKTCCFLSEKDGDEQIHFKEQKTTDHMQMTLQHLSTSVYIQLLTEKLDHFIVNSFIAKAQETYLKQWKKLWNQMNVWIWQTFAENYQLELPSRMKCKVVIGQKTSLTSSCCDICKSQCISEGVVIFDDLGRDTACVYEVQNIISSILKPMSLLRRVEYCSNGCAAQCKNQIRIFSILNIIRVILVCLQAGHFLWPAYHQYHNRENFQGWSQKVTRPWKFSLLWYWWYSESLQMKVWANPWTTKFWMLQMPFSIVMKI